MIRILFISIAILTLLSSKCSDVESSETIVISDSNFKFSYDLNEPNSSFFLTSELKEISGLSCSLDDQYLYAINDELANLYILDIQTAEIKDKVDFGKPDDYEGMCMVDDFVYIVESNGNLKVVDPKSKKRVASYDCSLSKKNNIEGLAYDASTKRLLLAAKGNSKLDGHKKGKRSIFSIPTFDYKVEKKPYLSLDMKKRFEALVQKKSEEVDDKMKSRIGDFAPSGLAIHPSTKDLYILSARGQTLTIVNSEGHLQAVVFLSQNSNPQPEGICFDRNGTLYISNEGVTGKGRIASFVMN